MEENQTTDVYTFNKGLPGFEELRKFSLQQYDDIFSLLSAVDDPAVAFMIVNPFDFHEEYEFELSPEHLEELDITDPGQIIVRCIVTLHKDIQRATGNLLAPVVFNHQKKLGKQIVLHNTEYKIKHFLWKNGDPEKKDGDL
ncbi:flagellar assembly protein FliW [Paenibacillus hubeiensis]|uniref:flagellar assembly protein FliW n=1 Tax=Paenibacillus hubeiensis TaxID=3077330 RepID=UPI0031BB7E6C